MTIQSEKTFPKTKARKIKLLILDVDGILTTPDITLASNGSSIKSFNVRDGLGLKLLQNTGVLTAIISGRKSETVITRSDEVGINYVYEGVKDKLVPYRELLQKLKLRDFEVCFMGDDLPDLPILKRCGLGITVPDATIIMYRSSSYVTNRGGGEGAVREVCELIMDAQGTLEKQLEPFLK